MESEDEMTTVGDGHDTAPDSRPGLTRPQAFNLYLSHAFSTWNARGYEFAAVGRFGRLAIIDGAVSCRAEERLIFILADSLHRCRIPRHPRSSGSAVSYLSLVYAASHRIALHSIA